MSSVFSHLDPQFVCADIRASLVRLQEELKSSFTLTRKLPSTLEHQVADIFSELGMRAIPAECWRISERFRGWDALRGQLPEVERCADEEAYEEYSKIWTITMRGAKSLKLSPFTDEGCHAIAAEIGRRLEYLGSGSSDQHRSAYSLASHGHVALSVIPRPDHTIDIRWQFRRGEVAPNAVGHNGLSGIATACDPHKCDESALAAIADEAHRKLDLLRFAYREPRWRAPIL